MLLAPKQQFYRIDAELTEWIDYIHLHYDADIKTNVINQIGIVMFCWIVYNESITVYHFRYTHKANIIKSNDFSLNNIEFDNKILIIIEPSSMIYLDVVFI